MSRRRNIDGKFETKVDNKLSSQKLPQNQIFGFTENDDEA